MRARRCGLASPLHHPLFVKAVELLLAAGADPGAEDEIGNTPFLHTHSSQPEVIRLLVDAGADINANYQLGRALGPKKRPSSRHPGRSAMLAASLSNASKEAVGEVRASASLPVSQPARLQSREGGHSAIPDQWPRGRFDKAKALAAPFPPLRQ